MKKIGILVVAIAAMAVGTTASAMNLAGELAFTSAKISALTDRDEKNLINWKVGDKAEYNMNMGMFGSMAMNKSVTKEEGNGVWVKSEVTGMMAQTTEMLFDRATGQVLKYIENGTEKPMPEQDIEVISQDEATVTVPAGTFSTVHIVVKVNNQPQVSQVELWANPRDIVMEGTAKQVMTTSFMPVTVELKSQTRVN